MNEAPALLQQVEHPPGDRVEPVRLRRWCGRLRAAQAVDEFAAFLEQNEEQLAPLIQDQHGVKAALDHKRLWREMFGVTFT